jgi:hypothetical protein
MSPRWRDDMALRMVICSFLLLQGGVADVKRRASCNKGPSEQIVAAADSVFTATILELLPSRTALPQPPLIVSSSAAVVRVRSVYKGDVDIETRLVVVEGFGSTEFCFQRQAQLRIQFDFHRSM